MAGRTLISKLSSFSNSAAARFSTASAASRSAAATATRASPLNRLRPLIGAGAPATGGAAAGTRWLSTRATTSSLNDPTRNWSNRTPKETILLDGCDLEHWLVVVEPPDQSWTRDQIIESYIETLAKVVGGAEEARLKIYSVSTKHYFAFGALVFEELSYKLKELPNVRWVLPDSYLNVKNRDTVQEFYQKMLNSVEARTMPPNAWLWSLIANCTNQEDIKLLFQILLKIRIFRLSNLRIHDNFNIHLCMKVSEACVRANALDYGLKSLWKHNVYGLTPTIGAAHHLLLHAKKHNDNKLMVKIMEVLKKNSLPLQPGTADIVFSICYSANKWKLISKYSRQFLKSGVKLHRAAFDIWMEFASKVGDAQAISDIENLKYSCVKKKTLASGFSWAKGYLIDRKPESAASIVHLLSQDLSENNKLVFLQELQKLTTEWPKKMSKKQNEEEGKAMAENLKSDIAVMLTSLSNMGSDLAVDGGLKC